MIGLASMIQIHHLSKVWPSFALREIDLSVEKGEYFLILGPTGAGKTVLMETIAGHHEPDVGRIWLDGRDVTDLPPEKRGIGFLYQDCWLFPNMSVAKNICFGLRFQRMPKADQQQRLQGLSKLLGIEHLLDRSPVYLSGGERRKVALARALAPKPNVLLLDEPLGTLDQNTRDHIGQELRELHRQMDMTTVHVTHDHDVARSLADRIAIINEGRIAQIGDVDEAFSAPTSEFVARFLGSGNVLNGLATPADDGLANVQVGPMTVKTEARLDGPCAICIRPESISLSQSDSDAGPNRFPGVVRSIDDCGQLVKLVVETNDIVLHASLGKQEFLRLAVTVTDPVHITFPPSAAHGFPRTPAAARAASASSQQSGNT